MTTKKQVARAILDMFYPPRCHACGDRVQVDSELMLCRACRAEFTFIRPPLCPRCGRERDRAVAENRFCAACLTQTPEFDSARSLAHYKPPTRTLLHRLKYDGDTGAAATLVRYIIMSGNMAGRPTYDIIVPVPLHQSRLKKRGLNQSLVLAQLLFQAERKKIVPGALLRLKSTIAQTGLDGAARRKNLRGAFAVPHSVTVAGKKVILVDDVFTTGTTVNECSKTLKNSGAALVDVLTVARV